MIRHLILGARGSELSLKQTDIVKEKLQRIDPTLKIEVKIITTTGDRNKSPIPLDTVGKGWFTKEIDRALLNGEIDLAVHSLKDLPEFLPTGLLLSAIPEREDPREVLVSKTKKTLSTLPKGAVIGTDSTRRQSQILFRRPDLVVKSIRGNVPTRLRKLHEEQYDAIFLAAAGLIRLGLEKHITEYFSADDFIPSPGQGALAIVIRESNKELYSLVKKIEHVSSLQAVQTERTFSIAVGGGCKMPVGAYAKTEKDQMTVYGMIGSLDGKYMTKSSIKGSVEEGRALGEKLAKKLLEESKDWYQVASQEQYKLSDNKKVIVITRPDPENKFLSERLGMMGYRTYAVPAITITANKITNEIKTAIESLELYDWLIFTSAKGVQYFMEYFDSLNRDNKILLTKKIGAVGPKTAKAIESYFLPVHFMPTKYTTKDFAEQIPNIKGKKMLLARSEIASKELVEILEKRGASVKNIPIYKTTYATEPNKDLKKLIERDEIGYITFTSPSTVHGFIKIARNTDVLQKIKKFTVLSIGPVTTKAAEKAGFKNIITADPHTEEGMIEKLKSQNFIVKSI